MGGDIVGGYSDHSKAPVRSADRIPVFSYLYIEVLYKSLISSWTLPKNVCPATPSMTGTFNIIPIIKAIVFYVVYEL